MIIVIFCSIICLWFTYLDVCGSKRNGMLWGFIIITLLGCIHYDYGNDYMSYYSVSQQVASLPFNFQQIMDGDVYREPGWALICYLFKPIGGFFVMVSVLNIIQNYCVYTFIKDSVAKQWWTLSVFNYLFITSFYLMNFSMMRQGFVVCVFLGLWTLIKKKKWIIPLIVLIACSFVHSSSKILIPFAFIGFLPSFKGKVYCIFYSSLLLFLWIGSTYVSSLMNYVMTMDDMAEYERYSSDTTSFNVGLGIIIQLLPLFVALWYYIKDEHKNDTQLQLVSIACLSFAITPFTLIMPAVGRLAIYFNIYSLGAMPITYSAIRSKNVRAVLLGLFIIVTTYDYIIFFSNPVFTKSYSEFNTIFSVL